MIEELLIFYLIYILIFFSYCGFGFLMEKRLGRINIYEKFFYGTILISIISFIINLLNLNYQLLNIFIFVIGIFIFIAHHKYHKEKIECVILLTVFFAGLLISKTHEDFVSYHYQGIINIVENNLLIGEGNFHPRMSGISILAFNQSILFTDYLNYKLIHIPIYLMFVSTIGYFLKISFGKELDTEERFFSSFISILLITKFSRLSEYGYDLPGQLILFICAHKILYKTENQEIYKSIVFFIYAVMVKFVTIFFIPVFLIKIRSIFQLINKKINKFAVLFSSILIIIFASNNFLKTGCLIDALDLSCFGKDKIEWSSKDKLKEYRYTVENWTKGFNHQKKLNYKIIKSDLEFRQNFNWVKYWIGVHFFNKILDFLGLVFFIFLLMFFFSKKGNKKVEKKYLILALFISFIFWFLKLPQFRFGITILTLCAFYLLINLVSWKNSLSLNVKKFKILLIISLLFFNFSNIKRINNEIIREDDYQYKNFPWFNEKNNTFIIREDLKILKNKHFTLIK